MKTGEIVEYIEHGKIICAVILKIDETKLKVLVESGREIKLSTTRVFHKSNKHFNLAIGKTQLLELIKQISYKRNKISNTINIEKLWIKTNQKQQWLETKSLVNLCFPNYEDSSKDKEAAVVRALFHDNVYFKFKPILFFPNTKKKIQELISIKTRKERHEKLIITGSRWIKNTINKPYSNFEDIELKKILISFYIFGKTSPYHKIATQILASTNINSKKELFDFMVKKHVWTVDENIDILRFNIPLKFTNQILKKTKNIESSSFCDEYPNNRINLTDKFTITIDGTDTLDFDDALSIEEEKDGYIIGIHISDVAHHIKSKDILDKIAKERICSIYMPDKKIPMLPLSLSEITCSLKKGKKRFAISTIVKIDAKSNIVNYNIFPSIIKVNEQLSYSNANKLIHQNNKIATLYKIAKNLRKIRVQNGATQIIIPEITVKIDKLNKPKLTKKENPSKILVSEMMILTNHLYAKFLKIHKLPAIFRSQPEPRIRTIKNHINSLFSHYMQIKMLKKLSLNSYAKRHCILGLNAYTTATSPIRKYSDLVNQRQIRAAIKIDQPYTYEEINLIIKKISDKTQHISKIQNNRTRYWILKYLENKIGKKEVALILQERRNSYDVLLKKYMLECELLKSENINLKPKDYVNIIIQHVNARNNVISIFIS